MKNPLIAFILAFFPGGGLLYLGKIFRGLVYMFGEFGLITLFFFIFTTAYMYEELAIGIVLLGVILYVINLIDTAITASKMIGTEKMNTAQVVDETDEKRRFYTIVLSFIPGCGHFQLGLMNRGITILASFLGLGAMVIFIAALSGQGEFLIFLLGLPVIWLFGFFDVMQQLRKIEDGEEVEDRSILEDIEMRKEDGKKSKTIATFLSIFPGVGHLYLGLQKRGLQLMGGFLLSIYILDVLRLGLFLFLIPIIWFFSFFDGMQQASKYGKEELEDKPIIAYLLNYQKWIGIGLIFIGLYYSLFLFEPYFRSLNIDLYYMVDRYFQTAIVCLILIGGGIKLLMGSNRTKGKKEDL